MSIPSNSEDFDGNTSIFDKRCGQRRWLGKEHNREKEMLHSRVKDCNLIQKTIESPEKLSKTASKRLDNKTNDDFALDVCYSMNKKNRWEIEKNCDILRCGSPDMDTKFVERNIMDRTVLTANKKKRRINVEENRGKTQKTEENRVEVVYNILKTHPSKDVSIRRFIMSKAHRKTRKHRENNNVRNDDEFDDFEQDFGEDSEDSEYSDVRTPEFRRTPEKLDFSMLLEKTTTRKQNSKTQKPKEKIENQENTHQNQEFDNFSADESFNIPKYLNQVGYTFFETEITFGRIPNLNFHEESQKIAGDPTFNVKLLSETQILIDASNWNRYISEETSFVIVISQIRKNRINFLMNSTIPISSNEEAKNLRLSVSGLKSLHEAVKTICEEYAIRCERIDVLKDRSNFLVLEPFDIYSDSEALLPPEARNFVNFGTKQPFNDICDTVREAHQTATSSNKFATSSNFSICSTHKPVQNLYQIVDGSKKCGKCLEKVFNKELERGNIPIDLMICDPTNSNFSTFDFLPAIVPLQVYNFYTRKVYEKIYHQHNGEAQNPFDQCKNCKSTILFDNDSESPRSCFCGFSWCSKCGNASHYPMSCEQFELWNSKWIPRYDLTVSQGNGNSWLMRIVCQCKESVFNVRIPSETAQCPKCRKKFDLKTRELILKWKKDNYYRRHRGFLYFYYSHTWKEFRVRVKKYEPYEISYRSISSIPEIKKSVVKVCSTARKLRLDGFCKFQQKIHELEGELDFIGILVLSALCMVENVTAWMYISRNFDRGFQRKLEKLMVEREELMGLVNSGNSDKLAIRQNVSRIQKIMQLVINYIDEKRHKLIN